MNRQTPQRSMLNRRLMRQVRRSWLRWLAISSIMAVGVACFVGLASTYQNLVRGQQQYYAMCRMGDFSLELARLPLTDLAALGAIPGVVELQSRITASAIVDLPDSDQSINGIVISLPDQPEPVVNSVLIRRGSYFTDDESAQVLVNEAFARRHGLKPGDRLQLVLQGQHRSFVVIGTAISSEFMYLVSPGTLAPDSAHFGAFYLKRSHLEEILDFQDACNQVVGTFTPAARRHPGAVLRELETQLDRHGVITVTPLEDMPSHRYLTDDIAGLAIFTAILPTLFLATGAIVINVLMMRITEQERTQIGTLKALGYGDWPLFFYYIKLALLVGLVGGLAGCVAGYVVSLLMTNLFHQFFEFPVLDHPIYLPLHLAGIGLSIAGAVIGTLNGASRVLRLNPSEAMRPAAPARGTAIRLERVTTVWNRLGTADRMVFRGMLRNWARTLTAVFAVAIGTSLLLCATIVDESLLALLEFQYRLVQRSDLDLSLKDARGPQVVEAVQHLPSVDFVEPILEVDCTLTHDAIQKRCRVTGLVANARLTIPRDAQGRPVRVPESGLLMSRKLAEVLHVRPGDEITLKTVKGPRHLHRVRVVQIAESYLGLPVFADQAFLQNLLGEEASVTRLQLLTNPGPQHDAALHRELKTMPVLKAVSVRTDQLRNLQDTLIATFQLETRVLILFAGVSYFSSVLNCVLISLAERKREIATLCVLGYDPWQIGRLFLREIAWGNGLGTLLGLPCGYLLGWFVLKFHDTELYRIPFAHPSAVWWKTLLLSLAFSLAGYLVVQREIFKTDWRDVLNVRE